MRKFIEYIKPLISINSHKILYLPNNNNNNNNISSSTENDFINIMEKNNREDNSKNIKLIRNKLKEKYKYEILDKVNDEIIQELNYFEIMYDKPPTTLSSKITSRNYLLQMARKEKELLPVLQEMAILSKLIL